MPRLARKSLEGSFFHIMSQGINKSYIFNKDEDKKKYIYIMYKLINEYNIKILAYCVMSNHVHLLVNVKCIKNLSSYMHKLNAKYAQYYNSKYKRVGFVFRNRFKSESIRDEEHLYNCINYIFNNPVEANICKTPKEYKFSNYKTFKNKEYIREDNLENNFIDVYEDPEEKCKYVLELFLKKEEKSLKDVVKNNQLLEELIFYLYKYNISFRCMEKVLYISREKIRKCYINYLKLPK